MFAFYQFKRWNIAKLLLDIIIFSFAAILLIWILFFNRNNEILAILTVEGIFSVISIVINILVYTGIVIWYLSIRGGKIPLVVRFVSGGIFLFVLTDLYYYYSAYNDIYMANSLIDAIYLAALLIIAIGGLMPLYAEKKDLYTAPALSTNVGNSLKRNFYSAVPHSCHFGTGICLI